MRPKACEGNKVFKKNITSSEKTHQIINLLFACNQNLIWK